MRWIQIPLYSMRNEAKKNKFYEIPYEYDGDDNFLNRWWVSFKIVYESEL